MYLRSRFDALTDGVFSVAMTLLVVDIQLPEGVSSGDRAGFVAAMGAIEPKLYSYALGFAVIGLSWLAQTVDRKRPDSVGRREAMLRLVYLFLVTLTPFTVKAVTISATTPLPAVWLYCGNLGGLGLLSALIQIAMRAEAGPGTPAGSIVSPLLLVVSSIIAAALAVAIPGDWGWAFMLNFLGPYLDRLSRSLFRRPPASGNGAAAGHEGA